MTRKPPPPIYRKPPGVDLTDAEGMRALAEKMREPDPLGTLIEEWTGVLRAYLEAQGARLIEAIPDDFPRGFTWAAIDRGVAQYRVDAVPPGVTEAVDALCKIREVRQAHGDARALAAFYLGATIERLRATEAFAHALESYRRSHALAVTDEQIRAAVASHATRTEAAAALGITARRLQDRCKAIGLPTKRNRKPTTSDE